jgi:integrase
MGDVDDPQGFSDRLRKERQRLADSTGVHDRDRETLMRWLRRLDGRVRISSIELYLRRCRLGSERSDTPLVALDEDGWHDLVFSLRHDHGLSDETVRSYEDSILLFLKEMTDAEWPGAVARTDVDQSGPDPDAILDASDVHALTTAARHQRDTALIEFLADTGARITLTLSLRVGDVDLSDPPTYRPNADARGLKDAPVTDYPLLDSAAALRAYVRNAHPRPSDSDVALFHKLKPHRNTGGDGRWNDDGSVDPNAMRQQLSRIADRAGVEKPVNPHAFRHRAITRMAREGYSRSQIEHRVHWQIDTNMWETYEHITSDEHNDDIFRAAGVLDDDAAPDRVRKECGTCTQPLSPRHEYCPNCGQPATPGATESVDDAVDTILDAILDADNPAAVEELRQLLEEVRDHKAAITHDDPS